jgi:hypothetical protein
MPLPKSFKTDESFLEKITIGATGTRRVFQDLGAQGHDPMELERGSMSFKIWKAIKVKRVRVPDILCLRCGRRVESRAKTDLQITMSHSTSNPERGWDFGLEDSDVVALAHCEKTGPGPLDWVASSLVQYIAVRSLRDAWRAHAVRMERPKGAQEGFEIRATWPSAVAKAAGMVEEVNPQTIKYRKATDNRSISIRTHRGAVRLKPLVAQGASVQPNQIIASVVARLPSPIEWVNKRRLRAKDAVDTIWWLSKTDYPKADFRNVLVPYSARMRKLLEDADRFYTPKKRPSGHDISARFGDANDGAIPSNLLEIPNTDSNSAYLRLCKLAGVDGHPARFPEKLPAFFVHFLTEPRDIVLDLFAGSNTTGAAAEKAGRSWLAFESNGGYLAASIFRFLKYLPEDEALSMYERLQTQPKATVHLRPQIQARLALSTSEPTP